MMIPKKTKFFVRRVASFDRMDYEEGFRRQVYQVYQSLSSLHHAQVARLEKHSKSLRNSWSFGQFWLPLLPSTSLHQSNSWHFLLDKDAISSDFIPGFSGKMGQWAMACPCGSPPRKTIAQELSQSIMKWRTGRFGGDQIGTSDFRNFNIYIHP